MPTLEDLGQKVKAKYPGQYDDISNTELGTRVKAKYPGSYDDFTAGPEADSGEQKQGGFGNLVRNFVAQLNPIPAIKEFMNRPEELGKAADAFHVLSDIHKRAAALPENKGKPVNEWKEPPLTPAEKLIVEKGMSANLAQADKGLLDNPLSSPALQAGQQASQGDLSGAAGTMLGGYGAPAFAGEVAPAVARGVTKVTAKAGPAVARTLMNSALKPGVADAPTLADARQVVGTALENNIPVTESGGTKLQSLIADYAQRTNDVIQAKARQGATVNPEAVASRLDQINTAQVLPEEDVAAINKAKQAFLARKGARPAGAPEPTGIVDASGQPIMRPGAPARPAQPVPLDVAQAEKQGTYRQIGGKYGELSQAQAESEKALARGYKEEMEAQAPELKALNAKEGEFLGLQSVLERAIRRAGNHDIVGLGDATAAAGGAMVAGPPGAALGFAARVLDYPALKSRLAIAINKASQKTGAPLSLAASQAKAAAIIGRITSSTASDAQLEPTGTGAGQ